MKQDKENIQKAFDSASFLMNDLCELVKSDNTALSLFAERLLTEIAEIRNTLERLEN